MLFIRHHRLLTLYDDEPAPQLGDLLMFAPATQPEAYGTCPIDGCGKTDGYRATLKTAGDPPRLTRWFVCHTHAAKWRLEAADTLAAATPDDVARDGTPADWAENAALLADYATVLPVHAGLVPTSTHADPDATR